MNGHAMLPVIRFRNLCVGAINPVFADACDTIDVTRLVVYSCNNFIHCSLLGSWTGSFIAAY